MARKLLILIFAVGLLSELAIAQTRQTLPSVRSSATGTIRVSSVGTVNVTPDRARVQVGVVTRHSNADAAVAANNDAVSQVLSALRAAGVADTDLQTVGFSVFPRHNASGDVTGFNVNNSVEVTTRNIGSVGALLTTAINAGANQVGGVHFFLADTDNAVDEALALAVAAAERKATAIALASGQTLGVALSIDTVGSGLFSPGNFDFASSTLTGSVPIEIGVHQVTASVTAVFATQ